MDTPTPNYPMPRAYLRSFLFDLAFYTTNIVACFVCVPFIFMPRKALMGLVYTYVSAIYFLERTILGLDFEVRGHENLPDSGPFIVAAKHQSTYETIKLHILFGDPAIVLKQELLKIPLWGQYLKKSDVIAIDRSTPETAMTSIQEGAVRMMAQGRPIVIFPQGTRVKAEQSSRERPYKVGVARMQEATGLPIVPMALNSGVFWPRGGFLKSPGTVVFEFLKPVDPGMDRSALLKHLETQIETASANLMDEACRRAVYEKPKKRRFKALLLLGSLLFAIYSALWFIAAHKVSHGYHAFIESRTGTTRAALPPEVYGFPGPLMMNIELETLPIPGGSVTVSNIHAHGWPFVFTPATLTAGPIVIEQDSWNKPLEMDRIMIKAALIGTNWTILDSALSKESFLASLTGVISAEQEETIPHFDLALHVSDHESLVAHMVELGAIKKNAALLTSIGLNAFRGEDGIVHVPIVYKDNKVYAGPFVLAAFKPEKPLSVPPVRQNVIPESAFPMPDLQGAGEMETPPAPAP